MGAAQNIGKKTKQTLINKSQQFRQGQTAGVGTPNATKYQKGGGFSKAKDRIKILLDLYSYNKSFTTKRTKNNPKVVSTGIKSVMNRTN